MATAQITPSPRDPSTRRDRLPRRQPAKTPKAPRSLDYPKGTEGASDYYLVGIPKEVRETFEAEAQAQQKSMRWILIRFMEKFGRREIAL